MSSLGAGRGWGSRVVGPVGGGGNGALAAGGAVRSVGTWRVGTWVQLRVGARANGVGWGARQRRHAARLGEEERGRRLVGVAPSIGAGERGPSGWC